MRNWFWGQRGLAPAIAAAGFIALTSLIVPAEVAAAPSQPTTTQSTQKAASAPTIIRPTAQSTRKATKRVARSTPAKSKTKQITKNAAAAKNETASSKAQDRVKSTEAEPVTIPTALANANAQMLDSDAQAAGITVAQSNEIATDGEAARYVVSADQVNDIDRAASGLPPPRSANAVVERRDDTDPAQTSLIGRIFIAIGGLLTIGSAVRMFIA